MSEVNYAYQLAQVRQRRREQAERLRDQGLSYRQIAARLGVSHPTVLEDLRVEQLRREDLAGMTPKQIEAARRAGKLHSIMSSQEGGAA